MFWRFHQVTTSHIDTLLDKEAVTLKELMDEDDVLQECKGQNKKLLEFLVLPENLDEMVNLIINEPNEDENEKTRFKYPNVACELLTSDVAQITEKLAGEEVLLEKLYGFIQKDGPLNPLLASFFSKTMGLLVTRQPEVMFEFLKSKEDFIDHLMRNFNTSAIMDLLLRLVKCIEPQNYRNDYVEWLTDQKVIQKLIELIDPTMDDEKQCNASQAISDLVKVIRDQMSQNQERTEHDPLLSAIEAQESVSELLTHILSEKKSNATLVSGINILLALLDFKKIGPEGQQEQMSALDAERLAQGVSNTLQALIPRLKDFHQLLLDPPATKPMLTTIGTLDPPLGGTRLQVAKLVSMLLLSNTHTLNAELAKLGSINILFDLFFKYQWNNFLHTHVELCVSYIVTNHPIEIDGKKEHPLLIGLLKECRLLERILEAYESNEKTQLQPGGRRAGYMGHLFRIANHIASAAESGVNQELIKEALNELPSDVVEKWNKFVSEALAAINKTWVPDLVGINAMLTSSEDGDSDFKDIPYPQDAALQQVFNQYRMEQMTSNFVEQFGFSEEEFGEPDEPITAPLDKISNINFTINADEPQGSEALFEQMSKERIRPFDDPDSDDEWEVKQITFSSRAQEEQSQAKSKLSPMHSHSSSSSSSGSSSDEDEVGGPKQIISAPMHTDEQDKMEIDSSEAWPPQTSDEVPMAVDHPAFWNTPASIAWDSPNNSANLSNPWESSTSSGEFDVASSEQWADFESAPFESSKDCPRSSSPIAMETGDLHLPTSLSGGDSSTKCSIESQVSSQVVQANTEQSPAPVRSPFESQPAFTEPHHQEIISAQVKQTDTVVDESKQNGPCDEQENVINVSDNKLKSVESAASAANELETNGPVR